MATKRKQTKPQQKKTLLREEVRKELELALKPLLDMGVVTCQHTAGIMPRINKLDADIHRLECVTREYGSIMEALHTIAVRNGTLERNVANEKWLEEARSARWANIRHAMASWQGCKQCFVEPCQCPTDGKKTEACRKGSASFEQARKNGQQP